MANTVESQTAVRGRIYSFSYAARYLLDPYEIWDTTLVEFFLHCAINGKEISPYPH
jgi:hypothetical protein